MINQSQQLRILSLVIFSILTVQGMEKIKNKFDGKSSRRLLTIKNGPEVEGQSMCLGLASTEIATLAELIKSLSSEFDHITLKTPFISQRPDDSFIVHMKDGDTVLYEHNPESPRPDRRPTIAPHTLYQKTSLIPLLAFSQDTFQAHSLPELGQLLSYSAKSDGGAFKIVTILAKEKYDEFFIVGIPHDIPAWSTEGIIIYCQKNAQGKIIPVAQGKTEFIGNTTPTTCSFTVDCTPYELKGELSFTKNSFAEAYWNPQ